MVASCCRCRLRMGAESCPWAAAGGDLPHEVTPHGKSRRWAAGAVRLCGSGEKLPSGRGAASANAPLRGVSDEPRMIARAL